MKSWCLVFLLQDYDYETCVCFLTDIHNILRAKQLPFKAVTYLLVDPVVESVVVLLC